ncbi:23S rRNA pseudouridine2457 synthase [Hymenobacter luteus]|uniref:Pseudouridine synthase n=2 Tax=Hymenobacter TaxID=89966 RepID=A0A7W9SZZ6_9BACT|nr:MULTISPECIES: pseudouridine synthase [Hymenobacter]MBB4599711.1 23S rRNA pseudouridine2457 synthase [Hymenobacter latericoloratus]MBB6057979.1 23S rRNA pseudouridine2457 synthase [Hymenobacter luteus]
MPQRHFLLYKPYGYLSQFTSEFEREQRKKRFLGELHHFPAGTMAIGRLDEHSEGLLLLTTDGQISAQVRGKDIEKEYYAQLDGLITDEAVARLQAGVEIGLRAVRYQTLPCQVRRLPEAPTLPPRGRRIRSDRHGPTSWVSITVTEGKFRQVRKMTAAAGFPTLRLVRVRIGEITLGELQPGQVREVADLLLPAGPAAS